MKLTRLIQGAALAVVSLAVSVGFAYAQPTPTSEEISAFSSEMWVRSDGYVDVAETISYYFPNDRHGIYRDLPLVYQDEDGKEFTRPLSGIEVPGNRFTEKRNDNWLQVKIGDPNRTVTGAQSYIIKYRVEGGLDYYPDHDELYWNVTGTEWTVPIRKSSAVVHLPSGIAASDVQLKCFTGSYGSKAENCMKNVTGSTVSFSAEGNLTIVVGFPKGHVAVLEKTYLSPWRHVWPLAIPVVVGIALVFLWYRYGRDPKGRGTHVVQYDPPDDQPPGVVGVVVDEHVNPKDFSATIVDLAVRGHLKIREVENKGLVFTSKDYEFVKLDGGKDKKPLRDYEQKTLDALFGDAEVVALSKLKNDHTLFNEMKKINKAMYDEVVTQGYFPANPNAQRAKMVGIPLAVVVILLVAGSFMPGLFSGLSSLSGAASAYLGIAAAIVVVEFIIFGYVIPRRTEKGVLAKEYAIGFKDYLATAEKYRLKWQEKEGIFEKFLPYAMVFGVAEKWADAFKDMGLKDPDWYEGRPGTAFSVLALSNSMSSLNSAVTTAMRSAPQKSGSGSGFGGGGFSGGGGGGGGGGSW